MPCQPFPNCFEFVNQQRATVVCSDQKCSTTFIYENKNADMLSKYSIDGCLIADEGAKCDFLHLKCTKSKSYFIELKGSDLIRAVEQIDRSIDLLSNSITDFTINARIVLTRVNTIDLRNSKYLKLQKKLQRLGGKLKKQSKQLTEVNQKKTNDGCTYLYLRGYNHPLGGTMFLTIRGMPPAKVLRNLAPVGQTSTFLPRISGFDKLFPNIRENVPINKKPSL